MTDKTMPPDLVEKVALAIAKVVEGPDFDPFSDPEAFDFAQTMAQAAIAALTDHHSAGDNCYGLGHSGCGICKACRGQQPAPIAPTGEVRDEFIAEALRLAWPMSVIIPEEVRSGQF